MWIHETHCAPLPTGPAGAEAEWQQHLLQRAASRMLHHADPDRDGPHARIEGRLARRFPRNAQVRQEVVAGTVALREPAVRAGAVVADRRRRHEGLRLRVGHRLGQQLRRIHPARPQAFLLPGRPAPANHVLARQVDHHVARGHCGAHRLRFPGDVTLRPAAYDPDCVSLPFEPCLEPRPDESGSPRQQSRHLLLPAPACCLWSSRTSLPIQSPYRLPGTIIGPLRKHRHCSGRFACPLLSPVRVFSYSP